MTAAALPASTSALPRPAASPVRGPLLAWQALERAVDGLTGPALNPLHHLGSLAFLCFWVLAASGIYLYAVIDTSVDGAFRSIEQLAHLPGMYGGWLRSVHRYAADALVIFMGLHLLREWLHGRFRTFRRFTWLTGVSLIVLAFVCGIGGFWLNWNQLGQYSATATAEWIDALPLLATPLARNFLSPSAVSDRLFSLFVFVHLGVALLMSFGLWFHIQRLPRAKVVPPRPLALATLAMFAVLAALVPVGSGLPADVAVVPALSDYDWILLFVHPLVDATSGAWGWVLVGGAWLSLLLLPALPRREAVAAVAQVDPAHCSGCRRCVDDCPYAAISLVPHPSGRPGHELALVDAERCASCGICAGACPSSTPFRSVVELATGIDLPQRSIHALRQRLRERLAAAPARQAVVLFACRHGAPTDALQDPDVVTLDLLCAGQLPPSFVEYALRDGAAAVLIARCAEGGCAFRDGPALLQERLQGQREPHLRPSVPRERWGLVCAGRTDTRALPQALKALRARIDSRAMPDPTPAIEVVS